MGRLVAAARGYLYFDTGAIYRALTVLALEAGVSPDDEAGLQRLALSRTIDIVARPDGPTGYTVLVGGRDLTTALRSTAVDGAVSAVSGHAEVRQALLAGQRRVARTQPTVMVGRDIGTVVLPDADLKLYLDASAEARARRRYRERLARGEAARFGEVLAAMQARDAWDSGRSVAPLAVAPDAAVVNTDACGVEDVVAHVLALVDRWPDELTTRGGESPCRPRSPVR